MFAYEVAGLRSKDLRAHALHVYLFYTVAKRAHSPGITGLRVLGPGSIESIDGRLIVYQIVNTGVFGSKEGVEAVLKRKVSGSRTVGRTVVDFANVAIRVTGLL